MCTTYSLEATSLSHASMTPLLSGYVPLAVLILLSIFQIKENIFLSPSSFCLQAEKNREQLGLVAMGIFQTLKYC